MKEIKLTKRRKKNETLFLRSLNIFLIASFFIMILAFGAVAYKYVKMPAKLDIASMIVPIFSPLLSKT